MEAANVPAFDGWLAWRVERLNGSLRNDVRVELAEGRARTERDGNTPF